MFPRGNMSSEVIQDSGCPSSEKAMGVLVKRKIHKCLHPELFPIVVQIAQESTDAPLFHGVSGQFLGVVRSAVLCYAEQETLHRAPCQQHRRRRNPSQRQRRCTDIAAAVTSASALTSAAASHVALVSNPYVAKKRGRSPLLIQLSPISFLVHADGSVYLDILQNQWNPTYDVAAIVTSIQVHWSEYMAKSKYEYVRELEHDDKLPNFNWIVVRIDGWHFHRFSEIHGFDKPNDERALNLMNSCAVSMLERFPDIVFAYGDSDEYSFIWTEKTKFCGRRESKILSLSVSFFTSVYVMKWKEFFPTQELMYPPAFDGRVICYPRVKIVRDYLKWRQADCHVNNQFNTCFWMLVKSGKTKNQAQRFLEGTQASVKNELLFQQFGINYSMLPAMFRKGSCVFRDKVEETMRSEGSETTSNTTRETVRVDHCDIIGENFWNEHSNILAEG